MSTQEEPALSQRRHWRVIVIGCVPVQDPATAVSVEPTTGWPLIDGAETRVGGEFADVVNVAVYVAVASAVMLCVCAPPSDHDAKV
jgi:hypothetical protein